MGATGPLSEGSMEASSTPLQGPLRNIERLGDPESLALLATSNLSDFFNPFLDHFARTAIRGGGEVWVSKAGPSVEGLLLYNHVERVGSIFTRDPTIAEALAGLKERMAVFSEFPLGARTEVYYLYSVPVPRGSAPHRFRHRVRLARAADHDAILRMLTEMYGQIDTSWLESLPRGDEKCLVVEIDGQVAGAGWVVVVNGHGRLHSLSVRPPFRRLGIGTDLWHARILWAERAGAFQVISEIDDRNVASEAIATAGGMRRIGRMYLSVRP